MNEVIENLRESTLSLREGVVEFSHQRPASRNALSDGLRQDYIDLLERIENDSTARVLIITGSGGSFCAGGDVKGMLARANSSDRSSGWRRLRCRVLTGLDHRFRTRVIARQLLLCLRQGGRSG